MKEKIKVRPLIYGGDHQRGMRSGTENTPGVVGFATAAEEIYGTLVELTNHLLHLKQRFLERIVEIPDIKINGNPALTAAHIVSVSFSQLKSEVMLHALEVKGIYISTGSACSSNKAGKSTTISAIGVNKEYADGTIRFSFCQENTIEEIDYCIDTMKEELAVLRKYTRRK